jgi:hypothetical protein
MKTVPKDLIIYSMKSFTISAFMVISVYLAALPDFRLSEVDSAVNDVLWCGSSRDVIFVLTELNSVYKSEDKGFSWTKLNDAFHKQGIGELEKNENEVNSLDTGRKSPKNYD